MAEVTRRECNGYGPETCYEASMHVLVEKPAAGCIEDVCLMQEAARRAGRVVASAFFLYSPYSSVISRRRTVASTSERTSILSPSRLREMVRI